MLIPAAGSIVVKDIPPYSIVGGVPAKIIRKRFSDSEISELLQLKWWFWAQEKIKENVEKFSNVSDFLEELGTGFSFIKSEYPLRLGNRYNYIDLLLFNIEYNCYVVVELKVTELKKEHIGQIQIYMNYIDKNLKKINQDKTIGIIIVRKNNKFVLEYCSDERILTREYELI